MPKINLDFLRNDKKSSEEETIFTDLHLDLNVDFTKSSELAKTFNIKDLRLDKNIGAVVNSFINLLTTTPGEKPLNPTFGINFGDLLFLPVSEERADVIGTTIIDCVERFEKRINLVELSITPVIDQQEYIVDFVYTIPRFKNQKLNLTGRLSRSGFYV